MATVKGSDQHHELVDGKTVAELVIAALGT
jgi:hypothetical protein